MMTGHLSPVQLRMFMPAHELYDMPSSDEREDWTREGMWDAKRADNRNDGLGAHVARHGVHEPVTVAYGLSEKQPGPMIWDGHHRIVAAHDADRDMLVPVHHQDLAAQKRYGAVYNAPNIPGWDDDEHDRFPSYP